MRPVVSGKLAYVRFDRNSYSIPHTHVRRPLTLLASATTVRLVEGAAELARHARSYDTGATIENLSGQDTSRALERRLRAYARPPILALDEIGDLAYDAHAADLLFQVISRRYEQRSIVVTTNLVFKRLARVA